MYTLEAATRHARLRAAERDEPVYVIELLNEREPENPALADYVPDPVEVLRIREEWEAAERAYRADPEAARAAGILPPWDDMLPSAEERLIAADWSDEADPITFDAIAGGHAAILLRDNFDVDIVRVAYPDGTIAAAPDKTVEWARIELRYGEWAASRSTPWAAGLAEGEAEGAF